MMHKIATISTLLLLVALLWGCAGRAPEKKSPEKKKQDGKQVQVVDTAVPMTSEGMVRVTELPTLDPSNIKPMIRTTKVAKSMAIPDPTQPNNTPSSEAKSSPKEGDEGANEVAAGKEAEDEDYTVVQIFYGTDRKRSGGVAFHPLDQIPWMILAVGAGVVTLLAMMICYLWFRSKKGFTVPFILLLITGVFVAGWFLFPESSVGYGGERGTLEMGTCDVSIPKCHQVAELESPSILSLEFTEDSSKHIILQEVEPLEQDVFLDKLKKRIKESEGQEALVFIHGYNVTFEDAARRTAQLAYDLEFKGAPILYSWPSQGSIGGYTVDENNVEWTVTHLKDFLKLVAKQSGAKKVHLVAHSMGNRAMTHALEKLSYSDAKDGPLFNQVVLAAPDIDADVFRRDLAPRIVKTAEGVTLYASSNDKALAFSKTIHGFLRAGESGDNITIVPGIDTIDVSVLDTSLLGHSYYGSNKTVLIDMAKLLLESKPPTLRGSLKEKVLNKLKYWVFVVDNLRSG